MKIQRDIRSIYREEQTIYLYVLHLIICYTYFQFSFNNDFVNPRLMHDSRFLRYFLNVSLTTMDNFPSTTSRMPGPYYFVTKPCLFFFRL